MIHPAHMKAVTFDRYGSPQNLSIGQVPVPSPATGEVLVKVRASTVSRTDTATLRGHPFFARLVTGVVRPKMRTPGIDFAGTVASVGRGVTDFAAGDRVFGLSPERFGAHAEYLCVPAEGAIAHVPGDLPLDKAVVGEGAWYAHGTTRLLSEGDRCLIYGASGAIGTAAVQLAKARGAHVVAVVGARHLGMARQLGADTVVNYEQEDFTECGDRFDLVLDAVGKTSWFACRKLLAKNGLYCATDLGPFWSNIWLGAWFAITGSRRVQVPFPQDAPGFVRTLAALMEREQFSGVFDRSYGLDDIVAAFRYVESGQKTGIVVVTMP